MKVAVSTEQLTEGGFRKTFVYFISSAEFLSRDAIIRENVKPLVSYHP